MASVAASLLHPRSGYWTSIETRWRLDPVGYDLSQPCDRLCLSWVCDAWERPWSSGADSLTFWYWSAMHHRALCCASGTRSRWSCDSGLSSGVSPGCTGACCCRWSSRKGYLVKLVALLEASESHFATPYTRPQNPMVHWASLFSFLAPLFRQHRHSNLASRCQLWPHYPRYLSPHFHQRYLHWAQNRSAHPLWCSHPHQATYQAICGTKPHRTSSLWSTWQASRGWVAGDSKLDCVD